MARSKAILQLRSHVINTSIRTTATAQAAVAPDIDLEWKNAKPFEKIPGPKPLPIGNYGNFWRVLPFGTFGGQNLMEMHDTFRTLYGPISRFGGLGRPDMVLLFDPLDVEKVFRNESTWPYRPGLESIDYYRRVTRYDVFHGNPGTLSSQGEEWQKNRSAVNQPMMKPRNVKSYHSPIQEVASEFVEKIRIMRDEKLEMSKDFSNELNKWALESIALVALDTRLGCLDPNMKKDSDGQVMIDSVEAMFSLFFKLDVLPSLWKYISTPDWRRFVKIMNNITGITQKHINQKLDEIKSRKSSDVEGHSVLEVLLSGEEGRAVAMTTAIDMLMAGIDTTSNSTAITIYYLAKNPEAQEKVFQEVQKLLPNPKDDLPPDFTSSIPYLKACIKESQRLTPLAPGNFRRMPKDMVLHGYQVPKGTDVAMSNVIMCRLEENFPRPKEFIPERWLKGEKDSAMSATSANPFVFLPFGFGARMCVGRRLAELEMHTLLTKIFRNFQISYNYGEMEWQSEMLITPKSPLKFKMVDRK